MYTLADFLGNRVGHLLLTYLGLQHLFQVKGFMINERFIRLLVG